MDDLLKYWLLRLVKLVLMVVDFFLDATIGVSYTGGPRQERLLADNDYSHSAHLVKIVHKEKQSIYITSYLKHFLYKHVKYVHPNYIVEHKNATLVSVEKNYAVFCVSDPDVDVLDTKQFPFAFLSQYLNVTHLIILPISSFHRLAEEVGDPKKPVGLVHMTARSGSTLIAQMMRRVPNVKTFAEAWAMTNIAEMRWRGIVTAQESLQMLKSSFRLLCKVAPGEKVDTFFFKMTIMDACFFPDIPDLFPQFKLFFNTRHPVASLKSYKQALDAVTQGLYHSLSFFWRDHMYKSKFFFPFDTKFDKVVYGRYSQWWQNVDAEEINLAYYAASLAGYFNGNQRQIYDHVILYENVAKDPDNELTKIFNSLSIPLEHIPLAKSALQVDSQKGQFGTRMKGRSHVLSKELLVQVDRMMVDIGAPIRHDMTEEEYKKVFGL